MMTTRLLQDAAQTTAYHTTAPAGLVLSAQQGPCLTYIHTSDSCNSHCSSVLLTTTMTPAVEAALSHNPKAGMQQCPDPEWVPLPGPHCGSSCSKSLGHTAGADALVYPQLVRLHAAALLDLSNLGLGGIPQSHCNEVFVLLQLKVCHCLDPTLCCFQLSKLLRRDMILTGLICGDVRLSKGAWDEFGCRGVELAGHV